MRGSLDGEQVDLRGLPLQLCKGETVETGEKLVGIFAGRAVAQAAVFDLEAAVLQVALELVARIETPTARVVDQRVELGDVGPSGTGQEFHQHWSQDDVDAAARSSR